MSVAAKAGEMQIFSGDMYGQAATQHRPKVSTMNISLTTATNSHTRQLTLVDASAHQSFIDGGSPEPTLPQLGKGRSLNLSHTHDDDHGLGSRPGQGATYGEYIATKSRAQDERMLRAPALATATLNPPSSMNVHDLRELYGIAGENRNFSLNGISQSQRDGSGPPSAINVHKIELPNQ